VEAHTIGIIGAGFSGLLTAFHLVEKAKDNFALVIINPENTFCKGAAYTLHSKKQLLNVITSRMSAFAGVPDHFLNFVMNRDEFRHRDSSLVANAFLPRYLYGEYLENIWASLLEKAGKKNIAVKTVHGMVTRLNLSDGKVIMSTDNKSEIAVDDCILATGNQLPGDPDITDPSFYSNKNYFKNSWGPGAVANADNSFPVLIIGNGLTMVDTVLGLIENDFRNKIYTISPHGFHTLPHSYTGVTYAGLVEELSPGISLSDLLKLVKKHSRLARELGFGPEPVIDSLRPHSQKLWKSFTDREKQVFRTRLRPFWDKVRHRIPSHILGKMEKLKSENRLECIRGHVINFTENGQFIVAEYVGDDKPEIRKIQVSRVINCSGSETDFSNIKGNLLQDCLLKGIISQDRLKLGIMTGIDGYNVINAENEVHEHLFTLGPNLKGELWESVAVNELRVQCEELAKKILYKN
jgi:uncharacterized NAD(P)/FAD-binding protein YdhS